MRINFASSTLKPSPPGWRLAYFDADGDPVASFWAPTKEAAMNHAAATVPSV